MNSHEKKISLAILGIILITSFTDIHPSDSLIVSKQPVAYYSFDGDAIDRTGNGNDGIVFGATLTNNIQGDSNKAYFFNGIDDNINVGVKSNIQLYGDMTICVWMKVENFDGNIQTIINCQADNTDYPETNALYSLHFRNNNNYLTYTHESGLGVNHANDFYNYTFEENKWYFIVITREIEKKTVKLFVDCKEVDKITYLENPEYGNLSGLRIGKSNGTIHVSNFNGILDEISIFDRIIDITEIVEIYESTAYIKGPTDLGFKISDNNSVVLEWVDNSEREDGFEIERKIYGQSYILLQLVSANTSYYIDETLNNETEYCYRVRAFKDIEFANHSKYSNETCTLISSYSDPELDVLKNFTLFQNYPNPFNPSTQITYSLPNIKSTYHVSIKIYDVLGRLIKVLVNESQFPGMHSVTVDGSDLTSGTYYYTVAADEYIETNKMILIK